MGVVIDRTSSYYKFPSFPPEENPENSKDDGNTHQRNPTRKKCHAFPKAFPQQNILPTCSGEHGLQFPRAKGPTQGKNTSNEPAKKHGLRVAKLLHDKAGGGKYPRVNHIGNHQNSCRKQADFFFRSWLFC